MESLLRLTKPTGIRSQETLPAAGRLQQRVKSIPTLLHLPFIMEPFFALFHIFPSPCHPQIKQNCQQAAPLKRDGGGMEKEGGGCCGGWDAAGTRWSPSSPAEAALGGGHDDG